MPITIRKTTSVSLPIALMACACSEGMIDLGGGDTGHEGTGSGRCAESTVIAGDVLVMQQPDLDALGGCEAITGDLTVALYAEASLSPLSSLREVGGNLVLGAQPLVVSPPEEISEEAYKLELERFEALREQGWLESLEGLEALTSVGGLYLSYVLTPDLHSLRHLETIPSVSVGRGDGRLSVEGARNLRDLSGLENVRVGSIRLHDNALESLDGLRLDETIQSVTIGSHPNLRDIQALAPVTTVVQSLNLSGTGIEDVDALAGLQNVSGITLVDNPRLSDVSGLAGLRLAANIQIRDNDLLTALPSFDALDSLDSIFIIDNAALEELHLDGGIQWSTDFHELGDSDEIHFTGATRFEIQRNSSLRRVTSIGGPLAVQYITIDDNPALTDIELTTTERVDFLSLTRNATLTNLTLPSLKTVDGLEVIDNPQLSPSVFANVKTFESVIWGNAGTP